MILLRHSVRILSLGCLFLTPALAQTPPDAGQLLQQTKPSPVQAPRPAQGVSIQVQPDQVTLPGGAQVNLKSVSLSGNSIYTEAQLLGVLSAQNEVAGKLYDLAGLRELAARISEFYRINGYPFARAYLPPQSMADGHLKIEVVEGQYGHVKATGDDILSKRAQVFLDSLVPGAVIESFALERATLILDDLPGLKIAPGIRPGQQTGTGDLDVAVQRSQGISGELGMDNHGNRYTGQNRVHLNLEINSPFTLGDQFKISSLVTEERMWQGSINYSLPIGSSGLRGNWGYSHTYYQIGKELASSDSLGTADVSSIGLSYPLIRSQKTNLTAFGTYSQKRLNDKKGGSLDDSKSSQSLPLGLNFDVRDSLGGGGVTYGTLKWTSGSLYLDDSLLASDVNANTRGHFDKINLDVARIQALSLGGNTNFILFGSLSAQEASKNLDSSERFGQGGATGVRAYPSGEGFGDSGWLAQLELRYSAGAYAPYVFYDASEIKINAKPWVTGVNKRKLAGAGVGLRYTKGGWSAEAALALRMEGGLPQADTSDKRENGPQAWVNLSYKF
jgi:hemolysin activation/secretion protein